MNAISSFSAGYGCCRVRALGSVGAFAVLSGVAPGAARAEAVSPAPPTPTYALSWVRAEGAEACPAAHALATEVERRLGRPVFDARAERSIEVDVTRFGEKYRSDVYVRDAAGLELGHRTLESDEPGCGALLSATALAVALVIDPDAASREPAAAPAAASFDPPPAAPLPPAPEPPALDVGAKTGPVQPALDRRETEALLRRLVVADVALATTYNLGFVPAAAPGAQLAVAVRPWQRWGFALSADYVSSRLRTRGIGSLDVGLTRGSALLLYYVAYRPSDVRLWLGAGPTLGAFHVGVRSPAPITDSGDFWFAAAEARVHAQVPVSKRFFVHAGLAAVITPWRQEFLVRGQSEAVWRQPVLAGSGFLGLGMTIP